MADNYLENKFEQHRLAAMSSGARRRVTPSGSRRGEFVVRHGEPRVMVCDISADAMRAVVSRLGACGFRVAFTDSDSRAGNALAQTSSARFLPAIGHAGSDPLKALADDMRSHWGGIDIVIAPAGDMTAGIVAELAAGTRLIIVDDDPSIPDADAFSRLKVNAVSTAATAPTDVAEFVLWLCCPASAFVDRRVFSFSPKI